MGADPGGGRVPLRVVVVGAHPDDDELKAGGTAALWARRGDQVLFVSVANGDAGHPAQAGAHLAHRRRREAEAAAAALGVRYRILDHHDGQIEPTLELRAEVIAVLREARADLVLLPRPWDYHADHRAVAVVVADALAMVTVPNVLPLSPPLARLPVAAYVWDRFARPVPFRTDVVVDTTEVAETKLLALHQHASQFYEWLAFNYERLEEVPDDEAGRLNWLRSTRLQQDAQAADAWRMALVARYGEERGRNATYAEAFEVCEAGRAPAADELERLFPLGA